MNIKWTPLSYGIYNMNVMNVIEENWWSDMGTMLILKLKSWFDFDFKSSYN